MSTNDIRCGVSKSITSIEMDEEPFEDLLADPILLQNSQQLELTASLQGTDDSTYHSKFGRAGSCSPTAGDSLCVLDEHKSRSREDGLVDVPYPAQSSFVLDKHIESSLIAQEGLSPTLLPMPNSLPVDDLPLPQLNPDRYSHAGRRLGDAGVLSKIEDIFASFANGLEKDKGYLSISVKSRNSTRISLSGETSAAHELRRVSFPGTSAKEAWRFSGISSPISLPFANSDPAVLVRLLGLMHEALVKNIITTKRCFHFSHHRFLYLSYVLLACLSISYVYLI